MFTGDLEDTNSAAADTGSIVHALVAAWHRNGLSTPSALEGIAAIAAQFPYGDTAVATTHFERYAADERNRIDLIAIELPVQVALPAHPSDPTGEPILLQGTLDQIRVGERGLEVWDLKTGKQSAFEMLDSYALQIAGYCMAASETLGQPVHPGGIIRTQSYFARTQTATHLCIPWSLDDALLLLDSVRVVVASIRRGDVSFHPGPICQICPARGVQECLPLLRRHM